MSAECMWASCSFDIDAPCLDSARLSMETHYQEAHDSFQLRYA